MSTLTKNLKLTKPDATESYSVETYNSNWDRLDEHSGTPCFVYATVPTEATVKADHPVPCFVFVTADCSMWYVS